MYYFILSVIVGIIALLISMLSTSVANWFIVIVYGMNAIYFLYKSFSEYNKLQMGEIKTAGEVSAIASAPFTSSVIIVAIMILIFTDYSKFHILWIAPIADLIFSYTIGLRAIKILNRSLYERDLPY